ncbi:hypothetical protein ACP70R_036231 [Stipagrostis hirtigluma subsp. patula]
MEPLSKLLQLAQQQLLFSPMPQGKLRFRASIYADDAAVFIRPNNSDIQVLLAILNLFGNATGLYTNLEKTEIYPIRCEESDIAVLQGTSLVSLNSFPCKYLGLPLSYRRLSRSTAQIIVNKVANRLPGWKRDLLNYSGRETLVKSVLSAIPTYFMTVLELPAWAIKSIDKYRRGFLWKGHDIQEARGGRCLASWKLVCRPKKLGGLGIKDLDKYGRSLRLRWFWNMCSAVDRPWKSVIKLTNKADRSLFFASTVFQVGNGKRTPFWEGNWLMGKAPRSLAPGLYKLARFKHRTVDKELRDYAWIRNLVGFSVQDHMDELIIMLQALQGIQLTNDEDKITWKWTANGEYTARSAYNVQFIGTTRMTWPQTVWKADTKPKCKFFAWLILHNRANTAEVLAAKNWTHEEFCSYCLCFFETGDHLFRECNFTEAVWQQVCNTLHLQHLIQTRSEATNLKEWVRLITKGISKLDKRKNLGVLLYFWWEIWKERNRRIFTQEEQSFRQVARKVCDDVQCYQVAKELS